MSRRLRYLPPEGSGLVEVTTRTVHGRFLLAPSPELNDLILGALGRAQELYPVDLVAFAFASGHYHLLLRVKDSQRLASFMNHLNSNLAREAGRLADWREKFWSRRFQAISISNEPQAQIERLTYILSHGVKEGLLENLRDWPSVSAVRALLDGEPLVGHWYNRTQEYAARQRGESFHRLQFATEYRLQLVPLPCWEHLEPEQYRQKIAEIVAEIEARAAAEREASGKPALGILAIRALSATTIRRSSRGRLPRSSMPPAGRFVATFTRPTANSWAPSGPRPRSSGQGYETSPSPRVPSRPRCRGSRVSGDSRAVRQLTVPSFRPPSSPSLMVKEKVYLSTPDNAA